MKSQLASQIAIGCVVLFAAGTLASAAPLSTKGLNAEDAKRLATALAAIKKDPKFSETSARYAEARKAYVADRAKFPAEREHDVAVRYHQATREFDAAQRQALLAFDATLAPLLAKAGALNRGRVLNEGETVADSDSAKNPAIAPITDVPGLPRVLLIGDSISIGYTLPVRELLKGKANVHRIPVNGGATDVGLERIKDWLGEERWDVIHFNFGLHDAKYASATTQRTSREQYIANLQKLVKQMQATGAKLIFATTTPVPKGGVLTPTRKFDSIAARNELAVESMRRAGVSIDDLYAVALPIMEKLGRPNDVHFEPEGYQVLAQAVAASIEAALPKGSAPSAD